jgi:hypothetical protein
MELEKEILDEFNTYLGHFGEQIFDSWCGKCVGWGYKLIRHCGDEMFAELGKHGSLDCVYPNWYLITKRLSINEAIHQYGDIEEVEVGPRGGFRTVTFGKTKFCQKELDPRGVENFNNSMVKVIK